MPPRSRVRGPTGPRSDAPNRRTRRDALRLLGAASLSGTALAAGGCSLTDRLLPPGASLPRMMPSAAPLPRPFRVPLPFPPTARPVRSDGDTDHYEITQRTADLEVLPGLPTRAWTYGGTWPGPTIEARSGRPVSVTFRNELDEPTVTHLHGGRTPAEHDGYPTDLVHPGEQRRHLFPLDQRASPMWYHDHTMDVTGPQVWRGLSGFFLLRDDEDDALGLPDGDRDLVLQLCDRSFAEDGSMPYPQAPGEQHGVREKYSGGVLGDVILVNGAPWPEHEVQRRVYRMRILNGSNARAYELSLPNGFVRIGSDGGLLARPERTDRIRLAPAERADVLVDFAAYASGVDVELRNEAAEGPQARVLRFAVRGPAREADVRLPDRLSRVERLDPAKAVRTRDFEFSSGRIDGRPGWLINGKPFDPERADARPRLGDIEIWRVGADVPHPFHMHLQHFQVLSMDGTKRTGEPEWRDTVQLGSQQRMEIVTRFTGYRGRYVFHCHNLEHEDMMMMANVDVV